ncbi:MAG: AAA family ATPase [candidate division Zixibacteria bacterium]|nr:AAA family ATPase [candidate division Zixibacteria bacterium]
MLLVSAKVGPFKSINNPQTVMIDKEVTVLVGKNEAGKTIFLQALQKSDDALEFARFDPVDDYPRKDLPVYLKVHKTKPAEVTALTYCLDGEEVTEVNGALQTKLKPDFQFSLTHKYDNTGHIGISVDETPVLKSLLAESSLSTDAQTALKKATSLRGIPSLLEDISLTEEDKAFLATVNARIAKTKWDSVIQCEVWEWLKPRVPKFLYFSDYDLLPSKMNLADLASRIEQAKSDAKHLEPKHLAVNALLRMADITIADFTKPGGYEQLKAKIEGVSINLTDQIMEFWKQNENLEVEVDIKTDPDDVAPFNNGANLYLRIKNRRHRGVSTPFQQRSRGFIWFFSFLVWFDSVQHQIGATQDAKQRDLILLLDEPGLALHALAQADFLRYIDNLSKKHQVLYTTHSPFMVHSDRLNQVRVIEDQDKVGTVISDNISGSDPDTIFPLQAALGWTIAQNLFISERNLLVEGPSELIYFQAASAMLEALGRTGLRNDVTIVPVGGLDKVVTFVALLGASGLKLAVLHDYRGAPEQKLMELVKERMISPKAVLNASQFRDLANIGKSGKSTDTEDLLPEKLYLQYFNSAFAKQLNGVDINENVLPPGDRIIDRLERYLADKRIEIRPSGGFNHFTVASQFASKPPAKLDSGTLDRFEALFKAVNSLF